MPNKTSKTRITRCLFWVLVLFACLCAGLKLYVIAANGMPKELRETTLIYYAKSFAEGHNPYTAESLLGGVIPGATNVYGFLSPLLLSLVLRIAPAGSALQVCEVASVLVEILGCVCFYRALRLRTGRVWSMLGTILLFGCYWRYTACGGAFPDSLGVAALCFLLYRCTADELRGHYHPVVYAVTLICLFYVKQYFVFALPGLVVWMFVRSLRDFVRLFLAGMTLGILSLVIVQLALPLYFTLTLAVAKGTTAVYDLPYSVRQIASVGIKRYAVATLLCVCGAAAALTRLIRRKTPALPGMLEGRSLSFAAWEAVCTLPLVIYIAQNHGTEYTYYLQLWWPWVIFCAMVCAEFLFGLLPDGAVRRAAAVCLCAAALFQSRSYTVAHVQTAAEREAWQTAYAYLDEAAAQGEILAAAQLSNYCLERGIATGDYGQAEYNDELNLNAFRASTLWRTLFPQGEDILRKNLDYYALIRENIRAQKYTLVAINENGLGSYLLRAQDLEDAGYRLADECVLVTGEQRWNTLFYTKEK